MLAGLFIVRTLQYARHTGVLVKDIDAKTPKAERRKKRKRLRGFGALGHEPGR